MILITQAQKYYSTGTLYTTQNNFFQVEGLTARVQQMVEWNSKKSVIRLNADKFKQYVRGVPRNYSVILMLTALQPQRQCSVCK